MRLLQVIQQYVRKQIHRVAKQTNEPVFLMIDDTICQKTKPSLQAKSPIEGCDHHFSHTEGKFVWGHQVVWMMIRCAHRAFPYAFARYDKTSGISKIALARQMIQSLHGWNHRVYVLFDSWHTSKSLIEVCLTKEGPCHRSTENQPNLVFKRNSSIRQRICPLHQCFRYPP